MTIIEGKCGQMRAVIDSEGQGFNRAVSYNGEPKPSYAGDQSIFRIEKSSKLQIG